MLRKEYVSSKLKMWFFVVVVVVCQPQHEASDLLK